MVICLDRVADLHMAQLMPLPLTVSCFSKIQIGFTFLVPAHLGSPRKGPLNGCVCVLYFFRWKSQAQASLKSQRNLGQDERGTSILVALTVTQAVTAAVSVVDRKAPSERYARFTIR